MTETRRSFFQRPPLRQNRTKIVRFCLNIVFYFILLLLRALRIAITATPTSAKTASHIPASPNAPNISTRAFTPRAKIIFSLTIVIVFRDIFTASAMLDGSSFISTTSAASMAISEPKPPIAIPISALAITGASFIPSPANATSLRSGSFISCSTFSTLFSGRSSLKNVFILCHLFGGIFLIPCEEDSFNAKLSKS